MDETAFPILLLDLLRREAPDALGKLERWWPMVRNAASFIVRNGPVTMQDRWEEDAGYSPFTLAAEISALLVSKMPAEQAVRVAARLGLDLSRCGLHQEAHRQGLKAHEWRSQFVGQLDTWEQIQRLASAAVEGPPAHPSRTSG
jgi:hypothetical protein